MRDFFHQMINKELNCCSEKALKTGTPKRHRFLKKFKIKSKTKTVVFKKQLLAKPIVQTSLSIKKTKRKSHNILTKVFNN